jgi:hypothetical protein
MKHYDKRGGAEGFGDPVDHRYRHGKLIVLVLTEAAFVPAEPLREFA